MKATSAYRFGMIAMVAMGSGSAWACDEDYHDVSISCDTGSGSICSPTGGGAWHCDLDDGGSTGAVVWAVYSTGLCGGNEYCVWGTATSGEAFCCQFDITGDSLTINGSDYADTFIYDYTEGSWDLSLEDDEDGTIHAVTYGYAGEDTVDGSNETNTAFVEEIHGGDDDDIIEADLGNDWIWGDDGYDGISGGGGDDRIAGGAGNDVIYGDAQDDHICGDGDADTIYGGAENDVLWGGLGADTMDGQIHTGGSEADQCITDGSDPTPSNCNTASGSRPGTCPSL